LEYTDFTFSSGITLSNVEIGEFLNDSFATQAIENTVLDTLNLTRSQAQVKITEVTATSEGDRRQLHRERKVEHPFSSRSAAIAVDFDLVFRVFEVAEEATAESFTITGSLEAAVNDGSFGATLAVKASTLGADSLVPEDSTNFTIPAQLISRSEPTIIRVQTAAPTQAPTSTEQTRGGSSSNVIILVSSAAFFILAFVSLGLARSYRNNQGNKKKSASAREAIERHMNDAFGDDDFYDRDRVDSTQKQIVSAPIQNAKIHPEREDSNSQKGKQWKHIIPVHGDDDSSDDEGAIKEVLAAEFRV
jgi:hypothetical protein